MVQEVIAQTGIDVSIEYIQDNILTRLYDTDGEKHFEQMSAAGIDKTALFLFDTGLLTGEPAVPIE